MPTRTENLFRIRSLLDDPYPQRPALHQLLRQEISEEQDVLNAVNNTGKAWTTAEYDLVLSPTEDTYEISATDFGKPIFVVRPTGNQYQPWISVPFTDVAELDYNTIWNGYQSVYTGLFGQSSTPEKMAFYRTGAVNSQYMVKVQPMPSENHTYTITYLVGYMGNDDPLEAIAALPEHAGLIQIRAAMALLPYSAWYDDEDMNQAKRKDLAGAFMYQLERKEELFDIYIRGLAHGRIVQTDDWSS
jgi:hypothetical protein